MSERYSRLFSLPENLYMEGAPVIIAAGALLKDNQTGKVLAQLKLRSIQDREIKAATVNVRPLDTAGRALGGAVVYQYLDIAAGRDVDFGQKTPVYLSDSAARSYTVSVTEVVFSDNAVWTAPDGDWTPLTPPVPLETALEDGELVKQYKLAYGSDSVDMYQAERDLWRCTCGALNHRQEGRCHVCGREAAALVALDMDALKAARDKRVEEEWQRAKEERIAEEKRLAEERIEREKRLAAAKAEAERRRAEAEARARIARKRGMIAASIAVALIAAVLVVTKVVIPGRSYAAAEALLDDGQYEEAVAAFEALGDYRDSAARVAAVKQVLNQKRWNHISAGWDHTAALRSDGTIVAGGDNKCGECDVDSWTDIVSVSAGIFLTVGLRSDGTVVVTGDNEYGECNVESWTNIVAVAAGHSHTVGLRSDGTVVATGLNRYGQCDVGGWTDIVAVAAGFNIFGGNTVGLRSDGTVVAVGSNDCGECDVGDWTGIAAVAAGDYHTVGLRSDGTVVAVGSNLEGQCDVDGWTDIIAVAAGGSHTVGLRSDGTVAAAGFNISGKCNVGDWTDIVAVAAGENHTVGLRSDGTVVAVGLNSDGQCNVGDWTNIRLPVS